MSPTLTMDQLRALLAVAPPPCPHHYAMAPDVFDAVLDLAVSPAGATMGALDGVEIRRDPALAAGTWEPRNRDGSRWSEATP